MDRITDCQDDDGEEPVEPDTPDYDEEFEANRAADRAERNHARYFQ